MNDEANLIEKGKILAIKETQVISDKFQKREFVIETTGQYPKPISFVLVQDKVTEINNYKVGDSVLVRFNLDGRSWTNKDNEVKYFNDLKAWRIETLNTVEHKHPVDSTIRSKEATPEPTTDDLPF